MKYVSLLLHFFVFSLLFANLSFGQYSESLVSDRPGQSNSPYTVGKKILQIQTGIEFGGINEENDTDLNYFLFPAYFRYGIAEKVEINAGLGFLSNKEKINGELSSKQAGIGLTTFAIRFNIFEESDKAPALGFEFTYKTKLLSSDFKPDHPSGKFNLMATKGFGDKLSLTSNLGADFNSAGGAPDGLYTLSFGISVDEHISVFFENYGIFNTSYFDTFFDFGGNYLLNNNLMLDIFGGFGVNNNQTNWLIAGGVSYRITNWRQ